MEMSRALGILKALCGGIDPYSGEAFQPDSAYQRADTVRALYMAVAALEIQERREKKHAAPAPNAGKPWTEAEDRKLVQEFDGGKSIRDISFEHGRTTGSIQARLVKFGKITL